MKFGMWIHDHGDLPLEPQVALAAQSGFLSLRAYSIDYAQTLAPLAEKHNMSLFGGIHVDAEELLADWRTQFQPDVLQRYTQLDAPLEAICIGNELREGGDAPDRKRFSARLAFGLANLLSASREWLRDHGCTTPVTYAMEEIVYDSSLNFVEWLWPVIDACDVVSINAYPMGEAAWFTYGAFEESRRFLHDDHAREERLTAWEHRLRRVLQQLAQAGKPVILSETGFPSAVGYHKEGDRLVIPEHDEKRYGEVMADFITRLHRLNADNDGRILAAYLYEWRDNLYHSKIWNVENSPIHTAFGLCDREGKPKFDLKGVFRQ